MFINRQKQMKEKALHNLTKLIVAKHRNCPSIIMVFIEKLICSATKPT